MTIDLFLVIPRCDQSCVFLPTKSYRLRGSSAGRVRGKPRVFMLIVWLDGHCKSWCRPKCLAFTGHSNWCSFNNPHCCWEESLCRNFLAASDITFQNSYTVSLAVVFGPFSTMFESKGSALPLCVGGAVLLSTANTTNNQGAQLTLSLTQVLPSCSFVVLCGVYCNLIWKSAGKC